MYLYYRRKFKKLSIKLGFSIGCDCLGYGTVIHHYGTIVIGSDVRIGNFSLINTSTCITKSGTKIGDCFFLGSGAKIIKKIFLGNNISIGANSVVTNSFSENDILIAGIPATKKKDSKAWYKSNYGSRWQDRVNKVEALRFKCGLTAK